jgi:serine/threonine protein kinase
MIKIITRTPPKISNRWSPEFQAFVALCLTPDPEERPSAEQLLKHPFLKGSSQYKNEYARLIETYVSEIEAYKAQKKAEAKAKRKAER